MRSCPSLLGQLFSPVLFYPNEPVDRRALANIGPTRVRFLEVAPNFSGAVALHKPKPFFDKMLIISNNLIVVVCDWNFAI
jgi:hypothetical protein